MTLYSFWFTILKGELYKEDGNIRLVSEITKAVHPLHFLFSPLCSIQLLQEDNKMTASNLAVVFAPTMMRSADNNLAFMKDLPQQTKLVETLILNSDAIFSDWFHFYLPFAQQQYTYLLHLSHFYFILVHILASFVFFLAFVLWIKLIILPILTNTVTESQQRLV